MYNKDNPEFFEVLRTRKPRPPFEQMAQLIAFASPRPAAAFPLYAKLFGPFVLGGILTAGSWSLLARHHDSHQPFAQYQTNSATTSLPEAPLPQERQKANELVLAMPNRVTSNPVSDDLSVSKPELVADSAIGNHTIFRANMLPARVQPAAIGSQGIQIAPNPHIYALDSDDDAASPWFITIGGAAARQFSLNSSYTQTSFTDGFLGAGYRLSTNSSIRILAGEDVFVTPASTTTKSISFHDTVIGSYQNVIGELQSQSAPTESRAYWLGASYRYTLGDGGIRPFAEVMAGAATAGFLTHQSLGAELAATNNIDLDLLFQTSELLPLNSSWLTKAGMSAELEFRW